jgi:hypothetical protein
MDLFKLLEDGRVAVRAGAYYLGDPCRPFADGDPRWDVLGNSCNWFQDSPIGVVDDIQVVAFHTARGDGCYDCDAGEILVDSGLIGLVPASVAEEPPVGMYLVEAAEGEICQVAGSVLWFGDIRIDTNPSDDLEADPDDEEQDEPAHRP